MKPSLLDAIKADFNVGSWMPGAKQQQQEADKYIQNQQNVIAAQQPHTEPITVSAAMDKPVAQEQSNPLQSLYNAIFGGVKSPVLDGPIIPPKPQQSIPQQQITATPSPTQMPSPTPTPQPIKAQAPTPTEIPEDRMKFLEENVFPITREHGIPDAVAATQWAVEGGRKTESPINNLFGLGGTSLIPYKNLQDNVRDYALTVVNILKNKGYDIKNMTADDVVKALQSGDKPRYEAHNPDPLTYVRTLTNTPEWRQFNR